MSAPHPSSEHDSETPSAPEDWTNVDRSEARRRTERAFDRLLSEPMSVWRRLTWYFTELDVEPWMDDATTALDDAVARRARAVGFEPVALADKKIWNGTRQLSEIWVGPEGFVKMEVVRALPPSELTFGGRSQRGSPIGDKVVTTYFDDATSLATWDEDEQSIEFETERRTTEASVGDLKRDRERHLEVASERWSEESHPLYCTDVDLYRDHFQMRYHHLTGARHFRTGVIRLLWNVVSKILWAGVLAASVHFLVAPISGYYLALLGLVVVGTVIWDVYDHYHAELVDEPVER